MIEHGGIVVGGRIEPPGVRRTRVPHEFRPPATFPVEKADLGLKGTARVAKERRGDLDARVGLFVVLDRWQARRVSHNRKRATAAACRRPRERPCDANFGEALAAPPLKSSKPIVRTAVPAAAVWRMPRRSRDDMFADLPKMEITYSPSLDIVGGW